MKILISTLLLFVLLGTHAAYGQQKAACDSLPMVPAAFSPNADGHNDCFTAVFDGCPPPQFSFIVSIPGGENIFETTDLTGCWDGTKGQYHYPAGVYSWTIRFRYFPEDKEKVCKGMITLSR